MATEFKIDTCWIFFLLVFGLVALCHAKDRDISSKDLANDGQKEEVCEDPKDCINDQGTEKNIVDALKYDAKHQVEHLYPKDIDDELSKIKIPQTFDEIRNSMQKCGQGLSKDSITGEKANSDIPNVDNNESMRQNARTVEDFQRMRTRLENWPERKPRAAIYLLAQPVHYRVNMLKGTLIHCNWQEWWGICLLS